MKRRTRIQYTDSHYRTLFIESRGALKNERPRKTLDFQTPIERYQQAVALTS